MRIDARIRRKLPVASIAVAGVILSLLAYSSVQGWEQEKLRILFTDTAQERVHTIRESISASVDVLRGVVAFYGASNAVTRREFGEYVTPIIKRHSGIQAVEWIPRVPGALRAQYEKSAKAEGFPQFEFRERGPEGAMIRAGSRPEYFPVYFLEPAKGNAKAFGFDLGSDPSRIQSLHDARDTGELIASERIKLVQGSGKFPAFLVFLPIYRNGQPTATPLERRRNLQGFALGVLRINNIVEHANPHTNIGGVDELEITVFDPNAPAGNQFLYSSSKLDPGTLSINKDWEFHHTSSVSVGNRKWTVIVTPSAEMVVGRVHPEAIAALIAGLLCTGLLATYVRFTSNRRRQIETEVQDRTLEILDITRDLMDRGQRIRAVHDTVVDGIITIDDKGAIETVNPAVERIFGYASEEIIGQNVRMLMPEPYRGGHDGYVGNFLNTGDAKVIGIGREVVGQRKDGSTFPMDLAVNEMRIGSQRMFTGIVRDITDRDRLTREASDVAERIRAVHDTVVDGIITIDDKGAIETVNPAVAQIFGYTSEEILGQNVRMLMPEPYRGGHDGYVGNFLNTGDAKVIGIGREVVGQRKDGSTFPMDLAVNEMRIGSQRMFTGIVRDITERKLVDRMKSDFIATVSHELRTPLASIVGYSDLIIEGDAGEISDEAEQFVEIISNNAVRLTELINDLLDIEKMESGNTGLDLKTLRLRDVLRKVHDTFRLAAGQKGLALDVADSGDLQMEGDANRLTQVFSNLVSNAIKYSREGSIKVSAELQGEEIIVKVADTGIGLSQEDSEKLFEKFFRANDEYTRSVGGTGLGLSIAKSIVGEHRGTIEVQSKLGEGTVFSVRMPAAHVRTNRTSSMTPESREDGDTPKILIIGNDAYPDEAIRTELGGLGVETVFATNAEEGLRLAGLIGPTMIVLEMLLEHGDGLRVALRLKKEAATANIPVALVSLLPDGNGSLRIGASSFVPKQVLATGLEGFVKNHIGTGGGKVLVIDDDPDFAAIIHLTLQKHGIEGDIGNSGAKALKLCEQHSYELILMDFHLPDMTGSEILNTLRYNLGINTPVVMMSGATIEKGEQKEVTIVGAGKILERKVQIAEIAKLWSTELNRGP